MEGYIILVLLLIGVPIAAGIWLIARAIGARQSIDELKPASAHWNWKSSGSKMARGAPQQPHRSHAKCQPKQRLQG